MAQPATTGNHPRVEALDLIEAIEGRLLGIEEAVLAPMGRALAGIIQRSLPEGWQ